MRILDQQTGWCLFSNHHKTSPSLAHVQTHLYIDLFADDTCPIQRTENKNADTLKACLIFPQEKCYTILIENP